jgi:carbamoyl-phosphate synthase large subunit
VKESVFPFAKFPGVDPILGPEMKSTGEVMGTGDTFDEAFAKAHSAAGDRLPTIGRAFVSVRDADKPRAGGLAKILIEMGFELVATGGTCDYLKDAGIACERVNKVMEGRPNIVDMIKNDAIAFIVNTTEGRQAIMDSATIRRSALNRKVCYTTTLAGGESIVRALKFGDEREVRRLQDLHQRVEKK